MLNEMHIGQPIASERQKHLLSSRRVMEEKAKAKAKTEKEKEEAKEAEEKVAQQQQQFQLLHRQLPQHQLRAPRHPPLSPPPSLPRSPSTHALGGLRTSRTCP